MTPFGKELRKMRASRSITLKQHAVACGVTPAYLSALEHGHRGNPTREMTERIVSALQAQPFERETLAKLLRYSRPIVRVDTSGLSPLATELANQLAENIAELSETDLQEILQHVRI